jgi:hypothetical protein
MPTFIYHDVEHERVSSHGVIGHEVLNEDDSPVRLEIRQSIEPAMNQEYMYDFGNGNNKTKPVNMLICSRLGAADTKALFAVELIICFLFSANFF